MSEAAAEGPTGARPFSLFERMVAWRYLRSRRKDTVISVISLISFTGIMLGVATLIIVMAVMNGFRAELLSRILGVNGHLVVQPIDRAFDDYAEVAGRINGVPGVRYAIPLIEGQVLATGRIGAGTGALVRGIREDDIAKLDFVARNIRQGSLVGFATGEGVAVGRRMAENLGLAVGDGIQLVAPEGDVTPFGVTPRQKIYPVVAIFEIGMSELDASIIYMPLEEAQLYFNAEGLAQTVEVFIDNPDAVDSLRGPIEAAAERQVYLTDWRQRNQTFFSALQVERNVMFMILTLIVLVAALNIISGLIMLVKDKGRDIAVLRAMGATRGMIMRIFFLSGASIGVAGTLAGFVLGLLFSLNVETIPSLLQHLTGATLFPEEIYFLSRLPAKVDPAEVASIVVMALALSMLATVYPAWRAARLDPAEALRYE